MDQPHPIVAEDEALSSEDLFELANLRAAQTGVPGTLYISTRQGAHGPRVKHYAGRPGADMPHVVISIEDPPRIVEIQGLSDREVALIERQAIEWVRLNAPALLRFWFEGTSWFDDEVSAFKRALIRL